MMKNHITSLPNNNIIHFCGIGGIGMSALAEIMYHKYPDCVIRGSDLRHNDNIRRLESLGIFVHIGHVEDIGNAGLVVCTSIISSDNPEVRLANKLGVLVCSRTALLSYIMQDYSNVVVGGSHGKTTVSAMVGHLFTVANMSPTIVVGAILDTAKTNCVAGDGSWMVCESDESDGSFVLLPSNISIITNIDNDHVWYYGSMEILISNFCDFANQTNDNGAVIICIDDNHCYNLISQIKHKSVISYGFRDDARVTARNIILKSDGCHFDIVVDGATVITNVHLHLYDRCNIANALAMASVGIYMEIPYNVISDAIESFVNVGRRLTLWGEFDNVAILEDYAHHPTAMRAAIGGARQMYQSANRLIVVYEALRRSRVKELMDDISKSFKMVDLVIVTDIFPSYEDKIEGIDAYAIARAIESNQDCHKKVVAIIEDHDILSYLMEIKKPHDVILFLGIGDSIKRIVTQFHAILNSSN